MHAVFYWTGLLLWAGLASVLLLFVVAAIAYWYCIGWRTLGERKLRRQAETYLASLRGTVTRRFRHPHRLLGADAWKLYARLGAPRSLTEGNTLVRPAGRSPSGPRTIER